MWRLATEYLFLRKLAPRSSALNAFYAGGFDHDEVRSVEVVMGACMLLRREAIEQVGGCDEDYFLFSEETDWCFRFREAGWEVVFFPGAECVHVRGASHSGRLYRENLRGHLLFLRKHRGPKVAERARRLLLFSLRLRGLVFRGERGHAYRDGAAWLASGDAATLRRPPSVILLYLKLAFATAVVLAPGWLLARSLGVRSVSATLAWSLAVVFAALAVTFALGSTLTLTLIVLVIVALAALALGARRGWPQTEGVPARAVAFFWGAVVGLVVWVAAPTVQGDGLFHLARVRKLLDLDGLSLDRVSEFADGSLHPGYAFPLWHGFLALVAKVGARGPRAGRHALAVHPRPARGSRRVRGRAGRSSGAPGLPA